MEASFTDGQRAPSRVLRWVVTIVLGALVVFVLLILLSARDTHAAVLDAVTPVSPAARPEARPSPSIVGSVLGTRSTLEPAGSTVARDERQPIAPPSAPDAPAMPVRTIATIAPSIDTGNVMQILQFATVAGVIIAAVLRARRLYRLGVLSPPAPVLAVLARPV